MMNSIRFGKLTVFNARRFPGTDRVQSLTVKVTGHPDQLYFRDLTDKRHHIKLERPEKGDELWVNGKELTCIEAYIPLKHLIQQLPVRGELYQDQDLDQSDFETGFGWQTHIAEKRLRQKQAFLLSELYVPRLDISTLEEVPIDRGN